MPKFKDISNQRFGELLTTSKWFRNAKKEICWECICDCGKTLSVRSGDLCSGNSKTCGHNKNNIGSKSRRWTGCGEISGQFWTALVKSAELRNIPFNIDIQYINDLWIKQNGRCALTNRPLKFAPRVNKSSHRETDASIDRIDNTKGYIKGNVQWVHKDVNRMKWVLDNDTFIKFCYEVIENERRKKESSCTKL